MKNIMKRAWELFKNTDGALFSECLKEAWSEFKINKNIKKENDNMKVFEMSEWIFRENGLNTQSYLIAGKRRENIKKIGTDRCGYSRIFSKENILKETEKAYLVDIQTELELKEDHKEPAKREVWIPKSQVNEICNYGSFEYYSEKYKDITIIKNLIEIYKISLVADFTQIESDALDMYYFKVTKKNSYESFIIASC